MTYQYWHLKPTPFPKTLPKQLEKLCLYGHLAPSSHNTQPWLFKISGNQIHLHADLTKRLKVADPTDKELFISIGTVIPNIEIAASHFSLQTTTKLFPNPHSKSLVATITLTKYNRAKPPTKELFKFITKRLTNRSTYQPKKPLPTNLSHQFDSHLRNLPTKLKLISARPTIKKLAKVTYDGIYTAMSNPKFRTELSHWIRHNWTKKGDGLPANTLGLPDAMSIIAPTLVRSPMMAKATAIAEEKMINSASAIGILHAPRDTKKAWLQTGIAFQYLALTALKNKVATAPLTAAIEIPAQKKQLKQLLPNLKAPMMFFRLGYPTKKFPHSPRRPKQQVISFLR